MPVVQQTINPQAGRTGAGVQELAATVAEVLAVKVQCAAGLKLTSVVVHRLALYDGIPCKMQDAVAVIQSLALQVEMVQGGGAAAVVEVTQSGINGAASGDEAAAVVDAAFQDQATVSQQRGSGLGGIGVSPVPGGTRGAGGVLIPDDKSAGGRWPEDAASKVPRRPWSWLSSCRAWMDRDWEPVCSRRPPRLSRWHRQCPSDRH